jgi:hypothetical protein
MRAFLNSTSPFIALTRIAACHTATCQLPSD